MSSKKSDVIQPSTKQKIQEYNEAIEQQSIMMKSESILMKNKVQTYDFEEKIDGFNQLTMNQLIVIQNQKISTYNFKNRKFEVAEILNHPIQIVKRVKGNKNQLKDE